MADQNTGITVTVDPDLKELIPDFLTLSKKDVSSMQEALDQNDLQTLTRLGHSFKGCGSGYGFHFLSEIGDKIERLAKTQPRDDSQALIDQLHAYLENVVVIYA